jgi:hypothetical protein
MGMKFGEEMRRGVRLLPFLPLLAALLPGAGCLGKTNPQEGVSGHESYYLNANLDFAIEYPQGWIRTRWGEKDATHDQYTVEWTAPVVPGEPVVARVNVTALPPSLAREGLTGMLEDFQNTHPGFVVTDRREIELPVGPARQILGHTPQRNYLVILLTSYRRAFTLSFSSPPEHFDQFRSAFLKMAESLILLE